MNASNNDNRSKLNELIDGMFEAILGGGGCGSEDCENCGSGENRINEDAVKSPLEDPITNRGLLTENLHPSQRMNDLIVPSGRFRVHATWAVESLDIASASLWIEVPGKDTFMLGHNETVAVLRRYSGSDGSLEEPSLTLMSLLRGELESGGATVMTMFGEERKKTILGMTQYSYWVVLGAQHGVALHESKNRIGIPRIKVSAIG